MTGRADGMPMKVEIFHSTTADGRLWIDVQVDGAPHDRLGPFRDEDERERATADLHRMLREAGGVARNDQ